MVSDVVQVVLKDLLKFIGPLKVKATPNLAVRVGKTQSACEVMSSGVKRSRYSPYHVNAQRDTDQ